MTTTFEKLQQVIIDKFGNELKLDINSVTAETTLAELHIESLEMFDLVFAIENAFNIVLLDEHLKSISTLQDIVDLIDKLCLEKKP